jgi:rod shape determining protein RodA
MATRVAARRRPRERHAHSDLGAFLRHIDYLLLAAVGAAIAFGIWVLGSVTQTDVPGDPDYYVVRQLIYVAVGAAALAIVMAINPEIYRRLGGTFFVVTVVMIAAVFALGEDVRGSKRWIEVGFFQFQPSELGKVLLTLFVAGFLADRARRIGEARTVISAVALVAVPTILVFEQPDFGTALVFCAGLAAALFLAGTRWLHLGLLSVAAALVALALLWLLPAGGVQVLEPYQIDRLVGFVDPDADPSGTTYNVKQSITAVGSGGLDGRGVAGATQTNLNYLPEHATDFIFSSLAEQRGFLGASLLLLLYALIVWRGVKIVAVAPTLFTAVVAGSLVFSFLFQVFVNVGMTIGIAPITGIPLPFVSAGGSSLITTMIMIGLLEAIHVRGRLAGRR